MNCARLKGNGHLLICKKSSAPGFMVQVVSHELLHLNENQMYIAMVSVYFKVDPDLRTCTFETFSVFKLQKGLEGAVFKFKQLRLRKKISHTQSGHNLPFFF